MMKHVHSCTIVDPLEHASRRPQSLLAEHAMRIVIAPLEAFASSALESMELALLFQQVRLLALWMLTALRPMVLRPLVGAICLLAHRFVLSLLPPIHHARLLTLPLLLLVLPPSRVLCRATLAIPLMLDRVSVQTVLLK